MTAEQAEMVRSPHPNDVCKCGDYRHQHKDGIGRCIMPDDLTHGFQPCRTFRLSQKADGDRYTLRAATEEK